MLSHSFDGMENSKRPAKEVFNSSTSPRQCLHHQEGVTQDAPTVLEHRADSTKLLGSSSSTTHRQLPCYLRRRIDNDDLLASIDRAGQKLTDCLPIAESALAMARCRSPSKPNSVEDRLAKAKARIKCEMPTTTFHLYLILSSRS